MLRRIQPLTMSVVTSTIQSLDGHVNEKRTAVMSVGQLETPPSEPLSATDLTKDVPFQRTLETPIEDLPVRLPTATIDDSIDHLAIAEAVVDRLNALEPSLLAVEAIWRDLFALTGTLRTFAGAENISHSWKDLADHHKPSNFELMPGTAKIVRLGPTHAWIAARFTFRTNGLPPSFCSGQVGIAPSGDDWKIWMITSILEELQGHPSPDFVTASGTIENQHTASKNVDYEAVVVGAGYAGLCLTGRLRAMGVHHLLIERNDSIGDNWLKRYDSARFHTSKYYSDMPLGPIFRDGYDYFPSAKDLARGYQEYATKHKLNVECSTSLQSATFDAKTSIWTLNLNTRGQARTLKTFNVVFAIGAGGSVPVWPKLENREKFNGTLLHSATYKNAHDWKGKRGVVIGSANTAHDVAEDMLDAGMSVTMVQRGRTMIIPVPTYRKWADTVYNPTVPIEEADRQVMAIPVAITRQVSLMGARALAAKEPERYDSLERRGFRCERNADLWKLLMERLGGHYM